MTYIFLSDQFYKTYPNSQFKEMLHKPERPYAQLLALINGHTFAIPLRSGIDHPNAFWTNKDCRCGLDFSKAVVVDNPIYIDKENKAYIRPDEFKVLKGKDYIIFTKMKKYIESYKKAKHNPEVFRNRLLCQYSTLQYFEDCI